MTLWDHTPIGPRAPQTGPVMRVRSPRSACVGCSPQPEPLWRGESYEDAHKAVPVTPRRLDGSSRAKEAGARLSPESSSVCAVVTSRGKKLPDPDR